MATSQFCMEKMHVSVICYTYSHINSSHAKTYTFNKNIYTSHWIKCYDINTFRSNRTEEMVFFMEKWVVYWRTLKMIVLYAVRETTPKQRISMETWQRCNKWRCILKKCYFHEFNSSTPECGSHNSQPGRCEFYVYATQCLD